MVIDYLDLVEKHGNSDINLFEKVKILFQRTQDLYSGKTSKIAANIEGCKPTTLALYELEKEIIKPNIYEKEETVEDFIQDGDFEALYG